jgi:hypothetical protein
MMKFLTILLLIVGLFSYGQQANVRKPARWRPEFNQFRKEDSLDGIYTDDAFLNVITDTSLPLPYSLDELNGWRHMQVVNYYYDSTNSLKKVSFSNDKGYYYFYFEGIYLKKARYIKWQSDLKYYYSAEDNKSTISEIDTRIIGEPEKKDLYETLKMGRNFFQNFQIYLRTLIMFDYEMGIKKIQNQSEMCHPGFICHAMHLC